MIVKKYICGPLSTNCYLIVCEKTKKAAVIDPAMGSFSQIQTTLEQNPWDLSYLFLTHSHWDHIVDMALFREHFSVPIYVHAQDANNVGEPGIDKVPMMVSFPGAKVDQFFQDQQIVPLGEISLQVIHTPGHSPGSICLYAEKEKILFSGDTLFRRAFGNIHLPTSSPQEMKDSLEKLSHLPKDTQVYPGHGERTTLGEEEEILQAKHLFY